MSQGRLMMAEENPQVGRREFLTGVGVAGAAAATALAPVAPAQAQVIQAAAPAPAAKLPDGYMFLRPQEAQFIEAVVDHMVPKDELTPSGTELGIATYIDRALAGGWGQGERLYMQGPWGKGTPNQGYQLPLTPAALYRAGIKATNAHCLKTYGKSFDALNEQQREEVLVGLSAAKITFPDGLPVRTFWGTVYQTVMEGMFSDPIYGGNRDKVGWRMIGFPGIVAVHRENIEK